MPALAVFKNSRRFMTFPFDFSVFESSVAATISAPPSASDRVF
jgi:hypothetical protein